MTQSSERHDAAPRSGAGVLVRGATRVVGPGWLLAAAGTLLLTMPLAVVATLAPTSLAACASAAGALRMPMVLSTQDRFARDALHEPGCQTLSQRPFGLDASSVRMLVCGALRRAQPVTNAHATRGVTP